MILLFALLVVWTSRWTVFNATALQNNTLNIAHADRRAEDQARPDPRRRRPGAGQVGAGAGRDVAAHLPDGLAVRPGGRLLDRRRGRGAPGSSCPRATTCAGVQTGLSSIFGPFGGSTQVGDDVHTTLDPKAQQVAHVRSSPGSAGSVVAIEPQTGAVKVDVLEPDLQRQRPAGATCAQRLGCLVNRRDPGRLSARLDVQDRDHHRGARQRQVHARLDRSTATRRSSSRAFRSRTTATRATADVTLTEALTNSINTVFAQVGETSAPDDAEVHEALRLLLDAAARLPARRDARQRRVRTHAGGTAAATPTNPNVDLGRIAIGQAACWSRRCRWRWSPPRSPTTAS